MMTSDMLNGAAKALGFLRPGGGLNPDQLADGLIVLNTVVDYFTTRKAFVYTTRMDEYTFAPKSPPDANNPAVYQLGPSSADWPGSVRPTRIEHANIVLNSAVPGIFYELYLMDVDEWAAISVEQLPVTLPTRLYCDYASPNANLYFWGQPTCPNILQLFTWQQTGSFAALNTVIVVPPGYYTAFLYSLAELLGPQWQCEVPEIVTRTARNGRAGVAALNSRPPKMATRDYGMPGGRRSGRPFNWLTRGL